MTADERLSDAEFRVLRAYFALLLRGGKTTMSAAAAECGVSRQWIAQVLRSLSSRGVLGSMPVEARGVFPVTRTTVAVFLCESKRRGDGLEDLASAAEGR